jgi:Chain length determinant protein
MPTLIEPRSEPSAAGAVPPTSELEAFLGVLARGKWVILLIALAGVVATAVSVYAQAKVYRANTLLQVSVPATSNLQADQVVASKALVAENLRQPRRLDLRPLLKQPPQHRLKRIKLRPGQRPPVTRRLITRAQPRDGPPIDPQPRRNLPLRDPVRRQRPHLRPLHVHALHNIHSALARDAIVVDTQPISARPPVASEGVILGELDMREWLDTIQSVDELVAETIHCGLYELQHESRFFVTDTFDDGPECLEIVRGWRGTRVPDRVSTGLAATTSQVSVQQEVRLRLLRSKPPAHRA